jgi:hypothetical protein
MKRTCLPRIISALGTLIALMIPCTLSGQMAGTTSTRDLIDEVSLENLTATVQTLETAGGHGSRVTLTPGNDSARIAIYFG